MYVIDVDSRWFRQAWGFYVLGIFRWNPFFEVWMGEMSEIEQLAEPEATKSTGKVSERLAPVQLMNNNEELSLHIMEFVELTYQILRYC